MTAGETVTFGMLLRHHRLAAGLSQQALAERAGLSADAIRALERGRRNAPRLETLALLATALALGAAERTFFITVAGRQDTAPGAESPVADDVPSPALPRTPTPLIGREREEAAVTHLLRHAPEGVPPRLLTLTGPGGVGKTRLALAVAAALRDSYGDGVVFVPLAALRDAALVASTIVQALGLREAGGRSARDLLLEHLRAKRLLLVLDNLEHLPEVAPLLVTILDHCPAVTILATSQAALRVRAEQQFGVPALAIPAATQPADVAAMTGYAAVRLFVARAQAVQPDFALSEVNVAAVAELCRRLDGLPLAIELAAARVRLLPPTAMLARLNPVVSSARSPSTAPSPVEHRLPLLVGGARDMPARQQTLRATIDWSYSLLSADEQTLFARLAVFAGGPLEAIELVCNPDGDLDILDGVQSLMEKSLLRAEGDGALRVGMLSALREYAWDQLEARGETERLRRAHAAYYLAVLERSGPDFGTDQQAWLERWEREHDNLRAALRWTQERGEVELGLRLAGALWRLWYVHGHLREGRAWLEALLSQRESVAPEVQAEAIRAVGILAVDQGDLARAAQWGEIGLSLYRVLGHDQGIANMLNTLGNIAREQGDYPRAVALYEESLAARQAVGDTLGRAVALNNLGTTARYQGDPRRALALYEESLALRRTSGDRWGIAYTLYNLGEAARELGQLERAAVLLEESLGLRRDIGDRQGQMYTFIALGTVARARGDVAAALAWYTEGVTTSRLLDDRSALASALEGLACVAHLHGDAARAARILGAVAGQRARTGENLSPPERVACEQNVAAVRAALADDAFEAAWAVGRALSPEQAIGEALDAS